MNDKQAEQKRQLEDVGNPQGLVLFCMFTWGEVHDQLEKITKFAFVIVRVLSTVDCMCIVSFWLKK